MIVMLTTAASTNKLLTTSIYIGQDCLNISSTLLSKFYHELIIMFHSNTALYKACIYNMPISLNSPRWAG